MEALLLSFGVLNDPDEMKKYKSSHFDMYSDGSSDEFAEEMKSMGVPVVGKSRAIFPTELS